jgi:hypothetical protein
MQITPAMLEQAARNLCEIRQGDPNLVLDVSLPGPNGEEVRQSIPQWKLFEGEILAQLQVRQACETAFAGRDALGRPVKSIILPH